MIGGVYYYNSHSSIHYYYWENTTFLPFPVSIILTHSLQQRNLCFVEARILCGLLDNCVLCSDLYFIKKPAIVKQGINCWCHCRTPCMTVQTRKLGSANDLYLSCRRVKCTFLTICDADRKPADVGNCLKHLKLQKSHCWLRV